MRNLNFFAIALMAACLASCGGKDNSEGKEEREKIVLTPETTQIKGDLGDYFEVVEKEYSVTYDNWGDMVSVEVKRTDVDYAFDLEGVDPYGYSGQSVKGHAGFGIELLDEDGNVVEKVAATASGLGGMYSSDDMVEALKLKAGETGTVRWNFHFDSDKKPVKFRLTSAFEEVDNNSYGDSEASSEDDESASNDYGTDSYSSSTSGSRDWDALLNSYEQYVDKYISYMKKAAKGDMNALSEYPELMEKAQELSSELDDAKGDMSASQKARYLKITNKMAKAAQQMH